MLVIEANDPYELFMLALHLDVVKFYLTEGGYVCRIPPISSARIYSYGIRAIHRDIPEFDRLVKNMKYLALVDSRRWSGSVKAAFKELNKFHGVEPFESMILLFKGLGEPLYETLGAYILRAHGYAVTHQALISDLLPYTIAHVPDLELARVDGKGFFLYELPILKYLGKEPNVRIAYLSVGEAKGSSADFSTGLGQLLRYLDSGLYEEGYLVIPHVYERIDEIKEVGVGLITWDLNGRFVFIEPKRKWGKVNRVTVLKEVWFSVLNLLSSIKQVREDETKQNLA